MSNQAKDLPPIRACLFDMDGLLINTEDLYTSVTNTLLAELHRPPIPWSIKARLQGRSGLDAINIFLEWANLPIPVSDYVERQIALQRSLFPLSGPLPGVMELLEKLNSANPRVHLALATSSGSEGFRLKSDHLKQLFGYFPKECQILGDDPRIPKGRGKPWPEIYRLALESINACLRARGETEILPSECLVFEDAVPGVEAGRRAGMRVVWVPHPGLLNEYRGREDEVLAGRTGEAEGLEGVEMVGGLRDGWAELINSLLEFDYEKYGINVSVDAKGNGDAVTKEDMRENNVKNQNSLTKV